MSTSSGALRASPDVRWGRYGEVTPIEGDHVLEGGVGGRTGQVFRVRECGLYVMWDDHTWSIAQPNEVMFLIDRL